MYLDRSYADFRRRVKDAITELHRFDAGLRTSRTDAARDAAQRLECLLDDVVLGEDEDDNDKEGILPECPGCDNCNPVPFGS